VKLYFIRHGENLANVERIMSYKIVDYSLTEVGKEQAQYLAEWLADRSIRKIYSSPLKRAVETAQAIADRVGLPEIILLEELREVNVGLLDGKRGQAEWEYHDDIIRRWFTGEPELRFEGGENRHELEARLKTSLQIILAENAGLGKDDGVAVVAHGGIFTFGLPSLVQNADPALVRKGLKNTALVMVEVDGELLNCLEWGSCAHLPATPLDTVGGTG
jgi:broad specificity phosphatase PhoE